MKKLFFCFLFFFVFYSNVYASEPITVECEFDKKAYMIAKIKDEVVFKDLETDVDFSSLKMSFKYDGKKVVFYAMDSEIGECQFIYHPTDKGVNLLILPPMKIMPAMHATTSFNILFQPIEKMPAYMTMSHSKDEKESFPLTVFGYCSLKK